MRLFVAVDIPDPIKNEIESGVVEPLRSRLEGAKWTRPEGRHLTLRFLGEVAESRISGVLEVMETVAGAHPAFDVSFGGVGGFPNLRRPRVLWVGVEEGKAELAAIASDLGPRLDALGFEAEKRPFSGHLTLARFPKPRRIPDDLAVTVPHATFRVAEVVLFRSQLHPKGARYSVVLSSPLSA